MIGRIIGGAVLVTAAMAAMPGFTPDGAPKIHEESSPFSAAPTARVQAAIKRAASWHVAGATGRDWVLLQLDQSEPRVDGTRRIVARGVLATPGGTDTHVRMSGIYDPEGDVLRRVNYELKAPPQPNLSRDATLAPAWSVQAAVQQALADASGDPSTRFALDSAQSIRLENGGRRFDGVGIRQLDGGDASFVSFTLQLSRNGKTVAFDYGPQVPASDSLVELAAEY